MPVPHLEIRIVQRSKVSSAVAGAAYQAGEKLFSEYDQKAKDHRRKQHEVVYTEIMLPAKAPPEYADRATLWNSVEEVEKQWNSQLARRFVVALPREVPLEMCPQMLQEYCQEHFVSKGMCCDFAIHDPDPPGHNPHCHIMLTMRAIDENGKWLPKSRKVYDLDENGERIRLPSGRWKSHKEDQVFQSDPVLHGVISYNILTGRIDICKPLWWERTTSAMSDTDFNYLMLYLEKRYGLNNENRIRRALTVVAHQNQYHPIREYLNRLEWDGTERIPYVLHHFLGAEICAYGTEVMRLFLLGAIHRVFRPGCKFELMLCLVGGQGAGKSTFFRFLACKDEWFSDDLKKIDDDNVFRKMQGHWIIEMSEMIATANARSIEDIKSFLSRSKETYKVPYATEPEDRLRQCVFGGTSNALDFLPLDRSGNRRFLPIMVHPEQAEVHILEDEAASRQYMDQLWAEAMTLYRRGKVQLKLSKEMNEQLVLLQKQFMPEDTKVGVIQAFLDDFNGDMVCSKLLHHEALGRFDEPKSWEIREINEIMNQSVTGWIPYPNPRSYKKYGKQRGWMRGNKMVETGTSPLDGFRELTEEECNQMELPF